MLLLFLTTLFGHSSICAAYIVIYNSYTDKSRTSHSVLIVFAGLTAIINWVNVCVVLGLKYRFVFFRVVFALQNFIMRRPVNFSLCN